MSSPQSWATLMGTPSITAAQSPTRSERRTMRGSRAPKACAASGATADTGPIPSTNPTNRIRWREADGRDRPVAEPPNECEVGGHHSDLAELGQRDGPRELDRFDDLGAP